MVMFMANTMVGEQACGLIDIDDDSDIDGERQFNMTLEDRPTLYMLQPPLTVEVTIVDDEG